jgi:hypothetical protein
MPLPSRVEETPQFSLILGGPLYRILRRLHLAGPPLELQKRRVLLIIAITWLPLFLLSAISGHLLGGQGLPFLRDPEPHIRFLVALPVLIIAELIVHQRIPLALKLFVERGIITVDDTLKFHSAIRAAIRVRDSVFVELALVVLAYTVGHWVWGHNVALGTATWYAAADGNSLRPTLPGYWSAFVSMPLGQLILFRWYLALAIWLWLLWRVSRLNLRLAPLHPDKAGGIGFLGETSYAFAPILFAQGALLAGIISSHVLYAGQSLKSFKVTVVILIGFFLLVILGPLTVFTLHLIRARRRGLGQYGTLATAYVTDFHDKWVLRGGDGEPILGTTDIQSLADLANSYAIVREMRIVPFGLKNITRLALVAAIPMSPLLLLVMPFHQLIDRLIKVIFF